MRYFEKQAFKVSDIGNAIDRYLTKLKNSKVVTKLKENIKKINPNVDIHDVHIGNLKVEPPTVDKVIGMKKYILPAAIGSLGVGAGLGAGYLVSKKNNKE